MQVIDLGELTKNEVTLLSGHDRGTEARAYFKIEELEASGEEIEIIAPENLDAVTPSFVQGLFAKSATLPAGRKGFLSRYRIAATDFIKEDLLVGIDRLIMRRQIGR